MHQNFSTRDFKRGVTSFVKSDLEKKECVFLLFAKNLQAIRREKFFSVCNISFMTKPLLELYVC